MSILTMNIMFLTVLILVLLGINQLLSPSKPDPEKVSIYECGFSAMGDSSQKFSVQFYLVAILFIIFDLEVILLFPFAVTLYQNYTFGFWLALVFLFILTVGYLYEYSKGALNFTSQSSSK